MLTCNETRILITNQCNYRCIFCHNEGHTNTKNKREQNNEQLCRAVDELIANGCNDITFTGGEPLLEHELLLETIQHIRNKFQQIPVTIVTNASLLNSRMLDKFADFGSIRFNISFHTANPSEYFDLTGQKVFSLDDLRNTITEIRCRNIPFKMNSVILRRTMPDAAAVAEIINFAKENGAKACKMIELLIVEENRELISECLVNESVKRNLPPSFRFINECGRQKTFIDDTGFKVELQKCRCHLGCEQCLKKSLTASLDVHGSFWACFSKTELKYNLPKTGYAETIRKGNEHLHFMFQKYRESSPSLIQKEKMVSGLQQVWFEIESEQNFDDIIAASVKSKIKTREEYFFRHNSSAGFDNEPQVLIKNLLHDPQNASLIIADISIGNKEELPVNYIKFFDSKKPPIKNNVEYLCYFLNRLGWTLQFTTLELNEQLFRYVETQYENAQFAILTVNDKQMFMFVDVDDENGMNLAKEFAGRKGIKPLALPYQEIMKSAERQLPTTESKQIDSADGISKQF